MRHIVHVIMLLSFCAAPGVRAQNFDPAPVPFAPANQLAFKMNLPITHLDINNYVASTRGVYAGRSATFKFYNRDYPWTSPNLFMRIRWDSDLDASNGVTWSGWFQDQSEDAFATTTKTYSRPGRYTITFEIEFYTSDGVQSYRRQKQYDVTVVPVPTAVFQDSYGNQLFYWIGSDGILNKPVLVAEGFDPDNSDTPAINYGLGFDLVELARSQGYDVFIMEWANGGADMIRNRDVFLSACQFLHRQLGATEAAIQVVGMSMGGVVARYGLAYAEDNLLAHAGQYIDHYVNTFVSFDAPQQGGHMNANLQSVLKENGNASQQLALRSMAAQQLLYEDLYDPTQSVHNDFYRNLRSLHNDEQPFGYTNGYPRRCVNYTVSNGNRSVNYPNLTTHDDLATVYEYANVNLLSIATFPVITHTHEILAQARDLWPGSTFPHDLRTLGTQGFKDFLSVGPGGVFLAAGGGWVFRVNFNPGYTPTESALDLDGYVRTAGGSLGGGKSWFDDTLTQLSFHRHEELSPESKNQVMTWLNTNVRYPYLGRPASVHAAPTGEKSVQIAFIDQAAFENGFKIERRIEGGAYAEVAAVPANQNQYVDVDPSLQLFKSYSYRVRAYSGSRYSSYSDEAPVILQPHLQSSTPMATSSNAQHKLVQTTSASGMTDLYLTYESSGSSYLTHYFVPASTWDPEQLIGGAAAPGISIRHPSLLLDSLGGNPYVVYENVNAVAATHTVLLDGYDRGTGTFYRLLALGSFPGDTSLHATPVAAVSRAQSGIPSFLVAAWRNGISLGFGIGCYERSFFSPGYSWSGIDLSNLFSVPSAVANPAVAITMLGPSSKPVPNFYIVWEEAGAGGGIRLLHGSYGSPVWPPLASQIAWEVGRIIHVADNTAGETNSRPAIALDASGAVYVAWQYRSASEGSIRLQARSSFTATVVLSTVSFSPCGSFNPSSPSISDYRYTASKPDDMTVTWSASNGIVCTQLVRGAWCVPFLIAPNGSQPNMETTLSASDLDRTVVYVGSTVSPYAIGTTSIPAPQPPLKTALVSPANTSTGIPLGTSLSWNCSLGALTYNVHINDDFSYSRDFAGVPQSPFTPTGLNYSTTYRWRVQAVNSSGTAAWSDTWTFKTQGPPQGGCPYVFGWNGEAFVADNNILPESEYPGNENRDVTDYYKLLIPPKLENGQYVLSIREFENEESHFDQIGLIAVDHGDSTDIAVLPEGKIIRYSLPFKLVDDPCRCNDYANTLSRIDGSALRLATGDSVALNFQSSSTGDANLSDRTEGGLLLGGWVVHGREAQSTGKIQMVGRVAEKENLVGPSSPFTFREHPTLVYIPLERSDQQLTVHFGSDAALDYANLALPDSSTNAVKELRLMSAYHTQNSDVTSSIKNTDGVSATLRPGESIELRFEAPTLPPDTRRSFILVSRGRYARIAGPWQNGVPQSFELGQNHPNPFNPQTTVNYQLAAPGHVVVVVFDMIGREITRLVDEDQEAGYYERTWDASSRSSGVYFARIMVSDLSGKQIYEGNRKLVLMR